MTDFKPGEIVDITIKGAQVTNTYDTAHYDANGRREDTGTVLVVTIDGPGRDDRSVGVNLASPGVTVDRTSPAFADGEVWKDRDGMLAVCQRIDDDELRLFSALGGLSPAEAVAYGPWTRVHCEVAS